MKRPIKDTAGLHVSLAAAGGPVADAEMSRKSLFYRNDSLSTDLRMRVLIDALASAPALKPGGAGRNERVFADAAQVSTGLTDANHFLNTRSGRGRSQAPLSVHDTR